MTNRRRPAAIAAAIHRLPASILIATKMPKATAAAKTPMALAAMPTLRRISRSHVGNARLPVNGVNEQVNMTSNLIPYPRQALVKKTPFSAQLGGRLRNVQPILSSIGLYDRDNGHCQLGHQHAQRPKKVVVSHSVSLFAHHKRSHTSFCSCSFYPRVLSGCPS